jgi:flagellar hook-associated protein 1 FlgK
MSYGLLNIGKQALTSNQTALSVVGQNIANVNTDGYSRQRPEFASRENIGGVEVYDITRIADQFLNRQIWADRAAYNNNEMFKTYANELDNLLASEATSISTAMDKYFGALQTAVDDPTSLPNRELFVAEADALVRRFNDMDANLERQNQSLNGRLESSTAQVNAIARNIAQLNDKLRIATAAGSEVNELLDKRDAQLDQLAQFVNFTTIETPNTGEISVYIGKGEPLVIGKDANELVPSVDPADSSKVNVSLRIGNNIADITGQIKGGQIGGLLEYRDKILDTARDQIGIITLAFADTMNSRHMQGMDLDGELGGQLFTDINSDIATANRVLSDGRNAVNVNARVRIEDTAELKASEYKLVFNSESSFTLIRESDGKRWESAQLQAAGQLNMNTGAMELNIDGFQLNMSTPSGSPFASGDQFVLRPARTAASDIGLVLSDPRQLALAAPVKVEADMDNRGTGVAAVAVTNIDDPNFATSGQMARDVEVRFLDDAGTLKYQVIDLGTGNPIDLGLTDSNGDPLASPYTFTPGQGIDLDGYRITIANRPADGDSFTVSYNEGGVSDNRNALAMSDLQFTKTVNGASYQDRYGQLIERVGTQTAVAQINAQASKSVLDANLQARSSLSGVNLDEEAAKLIQFQQAYQASAQLIRASQTIFDALMSAV